MHAAPTAATERTAAVRRADGPGRARPRGAKRTAPPAGLRPSAVGVAPRIVHDALRSSGRALEPGTRSAMETRFGRDLSHVRLHTGADAARSARAVDALAYTVGRHVVLGEGALGRDGLLAHELAHVVQQGHAAVPPGTIRIGGPGELEEAQAGHAERGGTPSLRRGALALRRKLIVSPPAAATQIQGELSSFSPATTSADASGNFTVTGCGVLQPTPGTDCVCDVIQDASRTYTINVAKATTAMASRTLAGGKTASVPNISLFPATAVQKDPDIDFPDSSSPVEFGEFDATGKATWVPLWRVLEHELCGHARLMQTGGSTPGNRKDHDPTIDTENSIATPLGQPARGHFADPRQGESFFNPAGNRSKIVFWQKDGLHYEAP